ncbi:MAG: HNH endonuclease signature motif containing protein [Tepidisphaeraceae bacterium]
MKLPGALQRLLEHRAGERCEYCRMHQALQGATFHVEHVIPRNQGGDDNLENLAWACPGCNLHKSDRIDARDPQTGQVIPLFNPRADQWPEHFDWNRYEIIALTPIGRATLRTLQMNAPRKILIRQAEELFALFPPDGAN